MKKFLFVSLIIIISIFAGCREADKETPIQGKVEGNIEDIAVNLVTDMSNSEFDKVVNEYQYSADMLAVISRELFETQIWDYLIESYGSFVEIKGSTVSKAQGYDIISVETVFENESININVVFDANKLVAGINHTPLE